jgi:RimJ/RimL family protein N-acetyltransferase
MMIVCEVDGRIAGNCSIIFNSRIKTRHRASVGIALLKDFWGLGIGTLMFEDMILLAKQRGVMQIELEVVEGNERAMALYRKMGFEIAAEKPNAICLKDGTLLKEFIMIKML